MRWNPYFFVVYVYGSQSHAVLKWSLLAGVGYFLAMTTAHFVSFKVPVLFIYYDVPFYAYQVRVFVAGRVEHTRSHTLTQHNTQQTTHTHAHTRT
jgi:hypothetical protein